MVEGIGFVGKRSPRIDKEVVIDSKRAVIGISEPPGNGLVLERVGGVVEYAHYVPLNSLYFKKGDAQGLPWYTDSVPGVSTSIKSGRGLVCKDALWRGLDDIYGTKLKGSVPYYLDNKQMTITSKYLEQCFHLL